MRRLLSAIFVLLMTAGLLAGSPLPEYKGPINDLAGILNSSDIKQLESKVLAYRNQSGHEIGVLIVPSLGDQALDNYAHDVFKAWGIGQKGKDDGVLFLVAIEEKKARVEVGYGLEGELTDLECGRLVNKNSPMSQHFREGDFAGGVGAVIDGIVQAIGGEYNPPPAKDKAQGIPPLVPFGFVIFFALLSLFRSKKFAGRRFGGPFGGFGGPFIGGLGGGSFGGGGGGGFSFGGGSSGGGGASGGW